MVGETLVLMKQHQEKEARWWRLAAAQGDAGLRGEGHATALRARWLQSDYVTVWEGRGRAQHSENANRNGSSELAAERRGAGSTISIPSCEDLYHVLVRLAQNGCAVIA